VLDFHNFVLQHYYRAAAVDFQKTLDAQLAMGEQIAPLVTDVTRELQQLRATDANVLFEGAQVRCWMWILGLSVRDRIQHYGGLCQHRHGLGPRVFDGVLGIVKAYTTRVGAGRSDELFDEYGEHLSRVGHEFGSSPDAAALAAGSTRWRCGVRL